MYVPHYVYSKRENAIQYDKDVDGDEPPVQKAKTTRNASAAKIDEYINRTYYYFSWCS
jgi:hypothetical protein